MSASSRSGRSGRSGRELRLGDVFHAMKTEIEFDWTFWIGVSLQILFKGFMRNCGMVLVAVATCLILAVGTTCLFILLPIVSEPFSLFWWWNLIFGIFLLINVLFNYVMAAYRPPGTPSAISEKGGAGVAAVANEEVNLTQQNTNHHSLQDFEFAHQTTTLCKKCNVIKPLRTHHCSICGFCVLKMDHHCPW